MFTIVVIDKFYNDDFISCERFATAAEAEAYGKDLICLCNKDQTDFVVIAV